MAVTAEATKASLTLNYVDKSHYTVSGINPATVPDDLLVLGDGIRALQGKSLADCMLSVESELVQA